MDLRQVYLLINLEKNFIIIVQRFRGDSYGEEQKDKAARKKPDSLIINLNLNYYEKVPYFIRIYPQKLASPLKLIANAVKL